MRVCSKCGISKPLTSEFFYAEKRQDDGFCKRCKECVEQYHRQWKKKNVEKVKAYQKKYRDTHQAQRKKGKKRYRENNKDKIKKYEQNNRHLSRARAQRHYVKHRDSILEKGRLRYRNNNRAIRERDRELYQQAKTNNPEKIKKKNVINQRKRLEYNARHRKSNKGKPYSFTIDDITSALNYFNGKCAVCERPLNDLFGEHRAAMDHWIPLSDPRPDNPGTIPTNMIPLCHGVNGCNNKKGNKDPVEWLITEFGKRKANKILDRVTQFFQTLAKRHLDSLEDDS